jgi:hypothetical protein
MPTVQFANGVTMDLVQKKGLFLGLGRVRCGGVALRSGRRPMFVEIRNPYGVEMSDFRLASKTVTPRGARLSFRMKQRQSGPMEWQIHECRRLVNTDWTARPAPSDARLDLILKPVTRTVAGTVFQGFSYQYRYASRKAPVYMLLDRGSWELGGRAAGNEFWMRSCFAPPAVRFRSARDSFSTEWYLPGIHNPNIFQFLPLQTELQGFAFQFSDAGVLATWATEVAHVRSLFEKPRGSDEFLHLHEHCGDLGPTFATAPVEVLFAPGRRDRAALLNVYEGLRELVAATLHGQLDMRRERITPYGQIEEWTDADFDLYRTEGLPRLLEAGCRTVYVANHFENNMNTYGVSNMCCTVDYKIAESVGEAKLKAFCDAAKAGGARVEMWGNTSVSTLTWILNMRHGQPKRIAFLPKEGSIMEAFDKAAEPFVRTTFGSIEADHYTPVFAVMNLRDPAVRGYWMKRWRYAADQVGLGGIFLDSSFNLSSDKFHYRFDATALRQGGATADQTHLLGHTRPPTPPPANILSQYRAHLDLMREMQQAGYVYCSEDLGVFGTHRHGPGVEKRLDTLFMWADTIACFDAPAIRQAGREPAEVYFRGLAYRMMWSLFWHVPSRKLTFNYSGPRGDDDLPTEWHLALLRAYNEVEASLVNREVLPGEKGVVYRDGTRTVLWAFEDLSFPLDETRTVRDVLAGVTARAATIAARKHGLYVAE